MKTRKTIAGLMCLTVITTCIASFIFTGCGIFGFKIDEETFPDDTFRNNIIDNHDHNKDNFIEADQIEFITGFYLKGCRNLQGIEKFTNVKTLDLTRCSDLSAIESLSNLSSLYLTDCKDVTLDFRKFPNLTTLKITNCQISVDIDLSDFARIKNIEIVDSSVKSLTLKNCEIFNKLYIHDSSADKIDIANCPVLNHITAKNVKNLSSVIVEDCPKMVSASVIDCPQVSELALRKCTDLMNISIIRCLVKEVDVRGCQYIWEVFNTPDALKVIEAAVRPENVIYCVSTDPQIKELNLPQIRIECPPDVTFITR